jgi:riboflavin kinase / FMN adenylyltransferase
MYLHRNLPVHPEIITVTSATSAVPPCGGVVTLGNFDGVHLGHQALIAALKHLARAEGLQTHVVTFMPHPRDYFAQQGRGSAVLNISSVRSRLMRLQQLGVDHVHVLRFNQALATLSPVDFVEQVHVVVGRDVRFGHQRAGDWSVLQMLGQQYGFTVHCFEEVLDAAALRISSSSVRHDLHAGHLTDANAVLGYEYALSGRVIHGRKLGRTLNCPTLNIHPHLSNPALRGVMVVAIEGLPHTAKMYGVASLGVRPTVENTTRFSLEVHVFDWSGDAYGQRVNIIFLHKLRDEARYDSLSALQTAIAKDMHDARDWLNVFRLNA